MKNTTRALRRHHTKRIQAKRVKQAKRTSNGPLTKQQHGRLKKHSFFDCGNPKCCLCRPHKYWSTSDLQRKQLQERQHYISHMKDVDLFDI